MGHAAGNPAGTAQPSSTASPDTIRPQAERTPLHDGVDSAGGRVAPRKGWGDEEHRGRDKEDGVPHDARPRGTRAEAAKVRGLKQGRGEGEEEEELEERVDGVPHNNAHSRGTGVEAEDGAAAGARAGAGAEALRVVVLESAVDVPPGGERGGGACESRRVIRGTVRASHVGVNVEALPVWGGLDAVAGSSLLVDCRTPAQWRADGFKPTPQVWY